MAVSFRSTRKMPVNRVRGKWSRRRFCAGLVTATAGVAAGCSSPTAAPVVTAPVSTPTSVATLSPPTVGKFLVSGNGNFFAYDVATRLATQVTHYPKDSFGAAPCLSPDRKRVAYTFYVLPTNVEDVGGSDLYVMGVDLSSPQLVLSSKTMGGSLESPCWSADGKSVDVTLRVSHSGGARPAPDDVTLYRVGLDGSKPVKLAERAQSPALSLDGKSLAFVGATTNDVWLTDVEARKVHRIVDGTPFDTLRFPRFAPSGTQIIFSASLKGTPPVPVQQGAMNPLRAPFAASIAEADHGAPWEIWTVKTDGSDLHQLTHMLERTPVPAWSVDGKWLAIDGGNGLSLVEAASGQVSRLSSSVYGGGIVWVS